MSDNAALVNDTTTVDPALLPLLWSTTVFVFLLVVALSATSLLVVYRARGFGFQLLINFALHWIGLVPAWIHALFVVLSTDYSTIPPGPYRHRESDIRLRIRQDLEKGRRRPATDGSREEDVREAA